MKAVIVADGSKSLGRVSTRTLSAADLIVAADGGAESLVCAGFWPHAAIGDFDSLSPEVLELLRDRGCQIIRYPRQKDKTDLELALDWCVEQEAKEIVLLGAVGGERLDHTLANVLVLTSPALRGITVRLADEQNEAFLLRGENPSAERTVPLVGTPVLGGFLQGAGFVEGEAGDTVSLIPLSSEVTGIDTEGLEYSLNEGSIKMGSTLGISNVLVAEKATISIAEGLLLVVVNHARKEAVE